MLFEQVGRNNRDRHFKGNIPNMRQEELISQYSIRIALFIVVAISAGMTWG